MKRFVLFLATILLIINLSLPVSAESNPESADISTVNEVSAPETVHKTGDMLNIIAFLLLAASAVAMIFVLFPKENIF